jgi:hypothetical protein
VIALNLGPTQVACATTANLPVPTLPHLNLAGDTDCRSHVPRMS